MTIKRFRVNKLVRHKTIERMAKQGITCYSRILDQEEYLKELKKKLQEETAEVVDAATSEEVIDELSDVLEVIHALAQAHGSSMEEVEKARIEKIDTRGGFEKRMYGEYFEIDADNSKLEYFQKQPHKYPEF